MASERGHGSFGSVLGVGWVFLDTLVRVGKYPSEDTKNPTAAMFHEVGGPVPRAFLALSSLSPETRLGLCATLGADHGGAFVRAGLKKKGIRLLLKPRAAWTTRSSVAWLSAQTGSRTVVYEGSRGPRYRFPAAGREYLRTDADILHLDGRDLHGALAACGAARKTGARIVVDVGSPKNGLKTLLREANTVIVSKATLKDLTGVRRGAPVSRAARPLLSDTCRRVFVTDGRSAVQAFSPDQELSLLPFPVRTVDSNGAGDVFAAGVLLGTLRSWSLSRTLYAATAAAALKCTVVGNARLPNLRTVERFLHRALLI